MCVGGGGGGGSSGRVYVYVVKFMGGGIMSTYTNLSRGGGVVWGKLSYTEPLRSQTF